MSIEKNIERIADALEALVKAPVTGNPPAKVETAKPAKAEKPVKAAPAAEPKPAEEVSKEAVGNAIVALIQANQREAAVKLLAKFGAKAVSEVKPENYSAVLAEASAILETV